MASYTTDDSSFFFYHLLLPPRFSSLSLFPADWCLRWLDIWRQLSRFFNCVICAKRLGFPFCARALWRFTHPKLSLYLTLQPTNWHWSPSLPALCSSRVIKHRGCVPFRSPSPPRAPLSSVISRQWDETGANEKIKYFYTPPLLPGARSINTAILSGEIGSVWAQINNTSFLWWNYGTVESTIFPIDSGQKGLSRAI